MIKITTLIENNANDNKKLINEHGLSLLIETKDNRYLFDTGQTSDFLKNAYVLNINLNNLDGVILSHGHYDHTGGIKELLKKHTNINNLYISKYFSNNKYKKLNDGTYKYNGIPFDLKEIESLICTKKINSDMYKLCDNIYIFSNFKITNKYEILNENMLIKNNKGYIIDKFKDEIAMCINTDKGIIIIAGCSHRGIINIVNSIKNKLNKKVRGIIGGTHLIHCNSKRLQFTLNELKKLNLEFLAVSHCTGSENINILKETFKDKFILNNTGKTIIID